MSYPNLETNKRIAEFMGYIYEPGKGWWKKLPEGKKRTPKSPSFHFLARHHRDLKYDTDYNWQMKVLTYIRSLGYYYSIQLYTTGKGEFAEVIIDGVIFTSSGENPQETIYKTIVKFVTRE